MYGNEQIKLTKEFREAELNKEFDFDLNYTQWLELKLIESRNKNCDKLPVMERYSHDAPIISEVAHSIASTYLVKKYNSDTHREVCEMIAKIVNVCIDTSE